jgi:hypothetical protein
MEVTIAKFSYDKLDGTPPKDRKVLVLKKPNDSILGVEFDDIKEVQNVIEYLDEKKILEDYLKHKHNLSTANYKRFKAAKIHALTEELVKV